MNISELYEKEVEQKDRQFEVLRSNGDKSGHHITLKPVNSESVELAAGKYRRIMAMFDESFKEKNKALYDESEKSGDFYEYNYRVNKELAVIRNAVCLELVEGWDFDNEFSIKELENALAGFPGLGEQIWDAYIAALVAYQKK